MATKIAVLKQLALEILMQLRLIQGKALIENLEMLDYHGFSKGRMPEEFMKKVLWSYKLAPTEIQAEIIHVTKDLRHEVHFHAAAHAYVVGLGAKEHLPEPRLASAYQVNRWISFAAGQKLEIPPGMKHGFTVEEGGELWCLSVQAPPIVNGHGRDGYHRAAP